MTEQPNVVLIHGAFADGSSWSAVVKDLQAKGYDVTAPQFPLTSLADDVARLRQALAWQSGPTVVVGHSYGGQVMTALGDDVANDVGLVYVPAFGLDEGESINAVGGDAPSPPALANLIVDEHGLRQAARGRLRGPLRSRRSIQSRRGSCTRPNSRSR